MPADSGADVFDVAAFLVASARDTLEATPSYGAFRMLEAVSRLAALTDDAFLRELAGRIKETNPGLMDDPVGYRSAVDELLVLVAHEAKARNLS
jgi:Family of unknown function (DUF6092)